MTKAGLSGADVYAAFHPDIGSAANVEETYGGLKGLSSNINYWLAQNPTATKAQAQAEMDKWLISDADIKRATGKTLDQLFPGKTTVVTSGGGVTPGGTQELGATVYNNGAYGNYGSGPATGVDYLGRTVSIATPGDIITNPDGTRTVVPNLPGRPYGGYTGMDQLRSVYTAGGGNLGQILSPTKTYQNTGLSADAYSYLKGEGKYPSYKQTVATAKDTFSSWPPSDAEVVANKTRYMVWRNGEVVPNPWFGKDSAKEETKTDSTKTAATQDTTQPVQRYALGGLLAAYAAGGMSDAHYNLGGYSDGGRLLRGPGDGVSDSIPATIGNKRPARLADGEFVVPARIVSEIGNGSTEAGARKLYEMMDRVQQARKQTVGKGRSKVAKDTRASKYLPV